MMPSSVNVGLRPISATSRAYSSGLRPCATARASSTLGSVALKVPVFPKPRFPTAHSVTLRVSQADPPAPAASPPAGRRAKTETPSIPRAQVVADLGEGLERPLVDRKPDEPEKQHVDLRRSTSCRSSGSSSEAAEAERSRRSGATDGLPIPDLKGGKPRPELSQSRVRQPQHRPRQMLCRDAPLDIDLREKTVRLILARHPALRIRFQSSKGIMPEQQNQRPVGRPFRRPAKAGLGPHAASRTGGKRPASSISAR